MQRAIEIVVPPDYRLPFPPEWSAAQNALAIDVGVEAVRRACTSHNSIDASKRELEGTLRRLLADRKPLDDEIARLAGELRSERELRATETSNALSRAREEARQRERAIEERAARAERELRVEREQRDAAASAAHARGKEEAREELRRFEDRALRTEEELRQERESQRQLAHLQERSAYERAMHQKEEAKHYAQLVQQAEERAAACEAQLRAKQDALAQMSVAANKGNAVEHELGAALREMGLHTADTSKGVFNTQYHDILVAAHPLREVADTTAVPRLEADEPTPRCSLESKAHSRSGGIGAEREKFVQVRRRLMEGRRAECFVFAAKTPIPGQIRWHFEFVRVDGRHCVTGYVGAADVSASEVCVMVQIVLKLQEKIDKEILMCSVPSDAALAAFVESAVESLHTLREQIARCDTMDKIAQGLRDETRALRANATASLLSQTALLTANGFRPTDDALADVCDAHASLAGDARRSTCKILRNKEQFSAAQSAVTAVTAATSSRKRPREP